MRPVEICGLFGLLLILGEGPLSGQETMEVLEGRQVRITYESNGPHVAEGLLREIGANAFLVAPSTERVVAIPKDQVTDFHVLSGQERQWKKGLGLGAVCGAATGTMVYLLLEGTLESIFGEVESTSPGVLAYTAVGALYGGGIGLGIGALFQKDRWEAVSLSNIKTSILVTPDRRFNLAFSVPLGR